MRLFLSSCVSGAIHISNSLMRSFCSFTLFHTYFSFTISRTSFRLDNHKPQASGSGIVPIRSFAVSSIVVAIHSVNSFVFKVAKTTIRINAIPKKLIISHDIIFQISAHVFLNHWVKFSSVISRSYEVPVGV